MIHTGGTENAWQLSAYLFPAIAAFFLGIVCIFRVWSGFCQRKSHSIIADESQKGGLKKVAVTCFLVIVYYCALQIVGFIPSSIIFLGVFARYLGEKKPLVIVALSFGGTFLLWTLFSAALGVRLP